MNGYVSKIQRYSTNDGPGIRSTVFLKGCNLKCIWCSNPELIELGEEFMDGESVAESLSAQQVVEVLKKDKIFYETSQGGITFSGGEPLLQAQFIKECIPLLKKEKIHIAIDSALHLNREILESLVNDVDLWLIDLKSMDEMIHLKNTGVSNERIIDNLKWLATQNTNIWMRCIVVNKVNGSLVDLKERLDFIESLGDTIKRVDILGYHQLGIRKYELLNKEYKLDESALLDELIEKEIKELMSRYTTNLHFERGI